MMIYLLLVKLQLQLFKQAEMHYNEKYDIVVQLMANAPIRNENDIKKHFNKFINQKKRFSVKLF